MALLYKTHQALVDGVHTVDLGQLLLDVAPEPKDLEPDDWRPLRAPSPAGLVVDAIKDSLAEPSTLVDTAAVTSARCCATPAEAGKRVRRVAAALSGRRPERTTPISGPLSHQRRVVTVDTTLADHRRVREAHGGTSTTSCSPPSPAGCARG